MSFESLGLSVELLRAVAKQGYQTPTPVQSQAIPAILAGRDLMAGAQTGTGKTAAFTLPLLQNLVARPANGHVRALVLTPTRELAAQVGESVRTYGRYLSLKGVEVYGGVNISPQIRALRQGADIVVATPGRLLDHVNRGTVDLSRLEILVLDEADRMLDMGFMPAIERILRELPKQRQTLMFSATFAANIKQLAGRLLNNPQQLEMGHSNAAAQSVSQSAYYVDADRKREILTHLIGTQNWRQVLVFTRTKRGADRLAKQLERDGIQAASIHGDKSQGARTKALTAFKRQRVRALVATDVAARGLDIDRLPHVVNYELPNNPEDYVHRIGRTGRGGQGGEAISLVDAAERGQLSDIGRFLKRKLVGEIIEGFEPERTASKSKPPFKQGRGRAKSGKPARAHGAPSDKARQGAKGARGAGRRKGDFNRQSV